MSGAASSSSPSAGIDPQAQVAHLVQENASLQQQGQALQTSHGQLQVQVQMLQAQLAQQAQAVPLGPTVPPQPHRAGVIRIPMPEKFSGRDGQEVDEWLDAVHRYINFHPLEFVTEDRKLAFVVNFWAAPVHKWRASTLAGGEIINTFADLEALMRLRYQPLNASIAARARLDILQQTGSVSAYTNLFLTIQANIPNMDIGTQIHAYVRGLKPVPQKEVRTQQPPVTTVHEAMRIAITAESFTNFGQPPSSGRYVRSNHGANSAMDISNINVEAQWTVDDRDAGTGTGAASSGPTSSDAGAALSVEQNFAKLFAMFGKGSDKKTITHRSQSATSAINSGGRSGGGLVSNVSRADYEKCRDHDACLRCKRTGHVAKECTSSFAPVPSNW